MAVGIQTTLVRLAAVLVFGLFGCAAVVLVRGLCTVLYHHDLRAANYTSEELNGAPFTGVEVDTPAESSGGIGSKRVESAPAPTPPGATPAPPARHASLFAYFFATMVNTCVLAFPLAASTVADMFACVKVDLEPEVGYAVATAKHGYWARDVSL